MKKFNEWLLESAGRHPLWWKVYDAMIRLDPDFMKMAPSREVEEIANDHMISSGWSPGGDADEREIGRQAEYILGVLKSRSGREVLESRVKRSVPVRKIKKDGSVEMPLRNRWLVPGKEAEAWQFPKK